MGVIMDHFKWIYADPGKFIQIRLRTNDPDFYIFFLMVFLMGRFRIRIIFCVLDLDQNDTDPVDYDQ